MYLGFLGSYGFDSGGLDGISLTYGLTFLKSASKITLSGFAFQEAKVPLYLPRIGLQEISLILGVMVSHFGQEALSRIFLLRTIRNFPNNVRVSKRLFRYQSILFNI